MKIRNIFVYIHKYPFVLHQGHDYDVFFFGGGGSKIVFLHSRQVKINSQAFPVVMLGSLVHDVFVWMMGFGCWHLNSRG